MTRQKKEIIKKVDAMQEWIAVDQELGCGFASAGVYAGMEREIHRLLEKLAHLQHYACVEDMLYDTRGHENTGCPW